MKTDRTTGFDFTNTKHFSLQPLWLEYLKTTPSPSVKGFKAWREKQNKTLPTQY